MLTVTGLVFVSFMSVACQRNQQSKSGVFSSGIVNGTDANGTEAWYGSVIGIGTKSSLGNGYEIFCSGSLIDEKTIVTAAHCLDYMGVGAYVIFGSNQGGKDVQGRQIVKAAFHEKFDENFPEEARDVFDIGVAQFDGGLPTGFKPLDILPDDTALATGTDVVLAGFGVTNGNSQEGAGILRYTTVKIQDGAYGKTEIETDETKNGSCNGDSGGPGLINVSGKWYIWGTTSRGDSACAKDGVYTKVTAYRDWILQKEKSWATPGFIFPLAYKH
jgi:secreted trypsin-like serine protease